MTIEYYGSVFAILISAKAAGKARITIQFDRLLDWKISALGKDLSAALIRTETLLPIGHFL
jgi:hypothetical protein